MIFTILVLFFFAFALAGLSLAGERKDDRRDFKFDRDKFDDEFDREEFFEDFFFAPKFFAPKFPAFVPKFFKDRD